MIQEAKEDFKDCKASTIRGNNKSFNYFMLEVENLEIGISNLMVNAQMSLNFSGL